MRTIKFKAILNKEAGTNADDYIDIIRHFTLEDLMRGKINFSFPEHWVVTQSIGLLDKNNKEIYEGDVVEWDDNSDGKWRRRCVVSYEFAHYALQGYSYNAHTGEKLNDVEFKMGAFVYEEETEKELEVIGNIYDNPELLN